MPKTDHLIFNLNAGELSPLLESRIDQSKYNAGCRTLQNMIPLIHGGVTRRPGTEYIANCKSDSAKSRLVAFEHSVDDKYVLEFANQVIRVYKDGAQVQSGGGAYEITTPYLTADLFELKFEHSADVMFIAHPEYEPRKLSRTGDATWTLAVTTRKKGPVIPENTTETTTITPSATSGSITLTASAAVFQTTHAPAGAGATDASNTGAIFRLAQIAPERNVYTAHAANGNSSDLTVYEGDTIDFVTRGLWDGTVVVERSYDSGANYETVWTTVSANNANDKVEFTEDFADALWRTRMESYSSGTAETRLKARSRLIDRYVTITAVASTTSATATVETYGSTSHAGLVSTDATWRWSEGAWSDYLGWPHTVGITDDDRLAFAGSTSNPLTVWASSVGDFECFHVGSNDGDAYVFTLAGTGQQNEIIWMLVKKGLILGTAAGEHRLNGTREGESPTPTNVKASIQTTYGSQDVQPVLVNDAILFVQRGGRKVREFLYDLAAESFRADDLSVFSEHITDSGIVDMAFQKSHDPMLWMVLDDGGITIMSYDRGQNVAAWANVVTETLSDQ